MNWKIKQEKLFLGTLHELTQSDMAKGLSEAEIISKMPKLSPFKTKELFDNFKSKNVRYIEEKSPNEYGISAAGMVYYEQLYAEWEMEDEQRKIWRATTSSINWTKGNILIGALISITTLSVVLFNCNRDTDKYHKELERQQKDTLQQRQINQSVLELKKELHQISLSLQDTAKVKVKIER